MKIKQLLSLVGLISTVFAVGVPTAQAIPLTFEVSGIGSYAPASAMNNDADSTTAVNLLITWYNDGIDPNTGSPVYTLAIGSGVPAPDLPSPATFGYKDDLAAFDAISSVTYSYILGKYGNVAYVFYIGNLAAGDYTLPVSMGGNTLSHEIAFRAPRTNVPDTSATVGLLGLGLVGLALLRSRKVQLT